MKSLIALFIVLPFASQAPAWSQSAGGGVPWSVQMAESIMERTPIVKTRWHYELGTVLTGFQHLYEATGDRRYLEFIKSNMDEFVQPDGSIETYTVEEYNLDQINSGKLLFLLHRETDDVRYLRAAHLLRSQLEHHPRTSENGFWHKQVYPYQMWLDGIYMASPFYLQYAIQEQEPQAFDDVIHQIELITRYTRDPATGLFYHAWDETRSMLWADSLTGRSENFWGRAMGWFGMALVDVLELLPDDHPRKAGVVDILARMANSVVAVQDPVTGTWYQVLDQAARAGNYHEASATAMFVYTLAKGVRLGYLDDRLLPAAHRGYEGMLKQFVMVSDAGWVDMDGIVSVGGLGGRANRDGSFEYYMSEDVVSNDWKGLGPFLMASVEIERAGGVHR